MVVPLHQDAVYWPLTPADSVSVWIAIDDVDEQNAAMQFAAGIAHRWGPAARGQGARWLPGARSTGRRRRVLPRGVADTLHAGQVSVHSDLLLHGSGANRSDRRRAGLTIRYRKAPRTCGPSPGGSTGPV